MNHAELQEVINNHTGVWARILTIGAWLFFAVASSIGSLIAVFSHPISDNTLSWLKGAALVASLICSILGSRKHLKK